MCKYWLRTALLFSLLCTTGCQSCINRNTVAEAETVVRQRTGCEPTGQFEVVNCAKALGDQRCVRTDEVVIDVEAICRRPDGTTKTIRDAVRFAPEPRWELATPTPTTPP